ncbi:GNAT family N-acetyltransferase [Enterococcus ureilyticus]|uniref:GNAT family N-acetyltransferase n=1 Tax=Enterococcus ureilyticus TaxID=1131292 RepID=A0A1E5HDR5_9ENTE|nr:GNAT family N-acetyltransferase [Enterococcus ureilyticus]MBM7689978.1 ribosomal protein S18 acetylase RimI-like enzyme [Enterococcus ureilyticus]OEG23074.1 GNAT family N-acetyltransferase [Enterococcus ureilyticus]
MIEIKKISLRDLTVLKALSIKTFTDTFAKDNTPDDLKDYLDQAYTEEKLTSELQNEQSEFYFIYSNEQLAGYLKINVNDAQTETIEKDALEIERIYIDSNFKRLGLGKMLYTKAIERAKELNKTAIWLGVWERNFSAMKFYHKMGFTQVGQHAFYMGEDEQIDLIMKKHLK